MNVKKTKTVITRKTDVTIEIQMEGKVVEQVKRFPYLRQLMTEDGRSEQEMKRRIGMAKTSFNKLEKILGNKKIQKRRVTYDGNIRRHNSRQKTILEGKTEGKRGRRRIRKKWIGNTEELSQMKLNRCC